MIYNTTILDNSTNMGDIFHEINTLSGGLLVNMFLLVLFLFLLLMMKNYPSKIKYLVSTFVVSIIAFMLYIAQMLVFATLIIPIVLLAGSIIYYIFSDN